ncbi:MAG: hypothetical protein JWR62_3177 [Modestobacter sp.]|nr:hypothetical protein [Modestobacter sp.]
MAATSRARAITRTSAERSWRGSSTAPAVGGDALPRLAQAAGRSGSTCSDPVTRVVPAAVLAALPDRPLTGEGLLAAMRVHPPTPVAVPSGSA